MNKRIKSIPALMLVLSLLISTVAMAAPGMSHFKKVRTYPYGKFTDVSYSAWYVDNVISGYEMNLIDGTESNKFSPNNKMHFSEAVKLAASLHSIYYYGEIGLTNGDPWYKPYVEYCINNGILDFPIFDYDDTITRGEFARIFASALPDIALEQVNDVEIIPDVSIYDSYGEAVYKLYGAGVLTGTDTGKFDPKGTIDRAQMATILSRMADDSLRVRFNTEEPKPSPTPGTNGDIEKESTLQKASTIYVMMDELRFHIADGSIATAKSGDECMDIIKAIELRTEYLLDDNDDEIAELGEMAEYAIIFAKNLVGADVSYVMDEGLRSWNIFISDYYDMFSDLFLIAG